MRIILDGMPVLNRSGTGYYVQKLVEAFGQLQTPHEFIVVTPPLDTTLFDRQEWPSAPNVKVVEAAPSAAWRQVLWRQWRFPAIAARYAPAVVHYPAFVASLRCTVPSVVTIPDVVWLSDSATVPRRKRRYYDKMIPASMEAARTIIAISHATEAEIHARFPRYAPKTRTVHLGVDTSVFRPCIEEQPLRKVKERYQLPHRFILALGTLEPRKNLPALVRAFAAVAANHPEVHLVLAGKPGYLAAGLQAETRGMVGEERIHFPGHIAAADLPAVYSAASIFAFPSLTEGFGLPILEAMACRTPVITSDCSSMIEVAGNAAELVNPRSIEAIGAALDRLLQDDMRRHELIEAGSRRVVEFPWRATAKQTIAAYEGAVA